MNRNICTIEDMNNIINDDDNDDNNDDNDDMNDLYGIFKNVIPRRKIHFNTVVRVILIPNRNDYLDAGLQTIIWYSINDLNNFKKNFMNDLIVILKQNNIDEGSGIISNDMINRCKKIWYNSIDCDITLKC